MPVVAVGASMLAMAAAAALCVGLTAIGRGLGRMIRPDRLTGADRRWLADQHDDQESQ